MSIFRVISDYESQFDDELRQNAAEDVGERLVEERAAITMAQRFLALEGHSIALTLRNGEKVTGRIHDVALTWVLLESAGEETLIPLEAVAEAVLAHMSLPEDLRISARLSIGSILRKLSQRSITVRIVHDAGTVRGTVEAVYADHVDILAERDLRTDIRDAAPSWRVAVPLARVNKISVTSTGW